MRRRELPKPHTLAKLTRSLWCKKILVDTLIFPFHLQELNYRLFKRIGANMSFEGSARVISFIKASESSFKGLKKWTRIVTDPLYLSADYQSSHVLTHIETLLTHLGCPSTDLHKQCLKTDIANRHRNAAGELVKPFGREAYAILFPGANFHRDKKIWPLKRYGEAIRLIGSQGPNNWIVSGTKAELEECHIVKESIEQACPNMKAIVSCGRPIVQVISTIQHAQMVLGADNGATHMAVAIGVPVVSIVGGMTKGLYFPWGNDKIHRAVTYPIDCWGCGFHCSQPSVLCIENITPRMVAQECRAVLEASNGTVSS